MLVTTRTPLRMGSFRRIGGCSAAICALLSALLLTAAEPPRAEAWLRPGDVIIFTGGENMVAAQEHPYLEMMLTFAYPAWNLRYRNMAWEADTVYEQRRELNFPPWKTQLSRARASLIFAQFGQLESLDGAEQLQAFLAAYEKLLDEFTRQTSRVILLSPFLFEKTDSGFPDLEARNRDLKLYLRAIDGLASRRGFLFVDLTRAAAEGPARLTRDGLHLTPYGQWIMSRETARQLGCARGAAEFSVDASTGVVTPVKAADLFQKIQRKNRLWFNYWRPMNWAFLAGDRTHVASSRDHNDPQIRWFPEEIEKFGPLIEQAETRIAEEAGGFK